MSKTSVQKEKVKYYSLDNILTHKAEYNIIYGERSNGKTTSVLLKALEHYVESGYTKQLGLIRRWEEDFKGKNGQQMYDGIIKIVDKKTGKNKIESITNDKYNSIRYWSQRWFLCKYDDKGNKVAEDKQPLTIGFALTSEEHYKSTSYPNIDNILFDEFMTRQYYLPDEFIKFQNILSTIIRLRDDVTIYMCGNTINKFCPYFNEMGLTGIKKQKQGTIDVYTYGDSGLKVAVEYADSPSKKKASNKYFAFNNPKLQMITTGGWEIDIYPHLQRKYLPKDVIDKFYILFDRELLQGNIISVDDTLFIYIHRKTTPIKEDNDKMIYQEAIDYRRNYRTDIMKPQNKFDLLITKLFKNEKVFYQDNEVGEIVNNYLKWCQTK